MSLDSLHLDSNLVLDFLIPGAGMLRQGVSKAPSLVTLVKGGGGLMEQIIKRSYSLTDLPQNPQAAGRDIPDGNQRPTRPASRGRRVVGSTANLNMRFPEVDVDIRSPPVAHHDIIGDIRSTEDISSGYSSTDQLYTEGVLTRSSSVSSARARGRGSRTVQPRNRLPLSEDTEESDDEYESPMALILPSASSSQLTSKIPPILSSTSMTLGSAPGGQLGDTMLSNAGVTGDLSRVSLSDKTPVDCAVSNDSAPQYMVSEVSTLEATSSISESLKTYQTASECNRYLCADSANGTGSQMSLASDHSDLSMDLERRGKYHKRAAPPPPSQATPTPAESTPTPAESTPSPTPIQITPSPTQEPSAPTKLKFPDYFTD